MTKMLRSLFLVIFLVNTFSCVQSWADEAVLKEIKLGWQSAIAASQRCTTFDIVVRTQLPDGSSYSSRRLVQKQGSKFVVGVSTNGTDRDADHRSATLRVYDGNHEAVAEVSEVVEQGFSRQQPWIMSDFKQIGTSAHQVPNSFRNLSEVGLRFGNSTVCLSYLFPDNDHIRVDKLTSESVAGRSIWRLEWSIVPEKKPKDIRTPSITNGILWLDPTRSYLPIRSEIGNPKTFWIKDKFTYRANLDSYYCEKVEAHYDSFSDGKTTSYFIQTQLNALSDNPISDEVFTFGHYGLAEPEIVGPSKFPWYLIIIGLLVVVGGVIARRYVNRSV
ncbi:MAG: hypothetical protein Q8M16_08075 [Pirellulaceae bacterium]|nr:hypothetical protein [Pirellulaceae bacterium]